MRALLAFLLLPLTALAETATLTWTAPTHDTEGRPLDPAAIVRYDVHWGWSATDLANVVPVTSEGAVIEVDVPPEGATFYTRVTACTATICSDFSNEASKVFPPKPVVPLPPTNVTLEFH